MKKSMENEMETGFIGVFTVSIKGYTLSSRSLPSRIVKGPLGFRV